jgi:hypothetical protein
LSARPPLSRRTATALAAASLLPAAAFATMVVRLWPFTADDAFITLRYARHLAAGWGPVWNAGPVHDEGYTSALWTLLLALPHTLAMDGELAAKALGTLAQLGAAGACFALANAGVRSAAPAAGPWWAWCAAALYALHPSAAVHAVSGMETAAFTARARGRLCRHRARGAARPGLAALARCRPCAPETLPWPRCGLHVRCPPRTASLPAPFTATCAGAFPGGCHPT